MTRLRGQFSTQGLFPSREIHPGVWMRSRARVQFLCATTRPALRIRGHCHTLEGITHSRLMQRTARLEVYWNRQRVAVCKPQRRKAFLIELSAPGLKGDSPASVCLEIRLKGVAFTNFLALAGRLVESVAILPQALRTWLQPFRKQPLNRSVLIESIHLNDDILLDFEQVHQSFDAGFLFKHAKPGVNVIGWFHGFLGVGESARACALAAKAAGLKVDAVNLTLTLNGGQSAELWPAALETRGNQAITIAHVDAPQSFDLVRKHPGEMDADRYRIGYWAWELPEFPDGWIRYAQAFDEIWCPSEFCRAAMSAKLPIPVQVMPHAITTREPAQSVASWREQLGLPLNRFLFLFSFDFNSYAPRKNPEAVVEAFKIANRQCASPDSMGLVLKMHGGGYRDEDRSRLQALKEGIPNLIVMDQALSREAFTGLQWACDSFVSLHRSEGFGLAPAEMMALGKPVITTDWSATSEFVTPENGCPVRADLIRLDQNVGPYAKGQFWADPDPEHAAEWMVRLVEDPPLAHTLGGRAKEWIHTHYSAAAIGKRYADRIKAIALFSNSLQE